MNSFLLYVLKSTFCISLLYLCFRTVMRKEAFFALNRLLLMTIVVCSTIIPLLYLPHAVQPVMQAKLMPTFQENVISTMDIPEKIETPMVNVSPHPIERELSGTISINQLLPYVYLAGIFISFLMLIYGIVSVIILFRKGKVIKMEGYRLLVIEKEISAFSFGSLVIISKSDNETHAQTILAHEQAHIRLNHSFDLLLLEVAKIAHWFNPVIYWLIRDMRDIHEFQADDYTLHQGIDATQYQLLIIQKCVGHQKFALANSFNHCQIKNRITMMNKQKTNKAWSWKVATFLPLLALLLMAFGKTGENVPINVFKSLEINQENPIEQLYFSIEIKKDGNYFDNKLCSFKDLLNEKKTFDSYNPETQFGIRLIYQEGVSIPVGRFTEIYDKLSSQNPNILMMMMNNADFQAEFPGGLKAMFNWLSKNARYPTMAQTNRIQGEVLVNFLVNTEGKVEHCTLLSYNDSELNTEALRVVSNMPVWKPAMKNGEPVTVYYTVPIAFRLK